MSSLSFIVLVTQVAAGPLMFMVKQNGWLGESWTWDIDQTHTPTTKFLSLQQCHIYGKTCCWFSYQYLTYCKTKTLPHMLIYHNEWLLMYSM
jgi:hypothetical protein